MATSYDYNYRDVLRVVTELGENQWDLIGVEMELSPARIDSLTNKSPTNAGKLRAIIDNQRTVLGTEGVIKKLLDACGTLDNPILMMVEEKLKKLGNSKQPGKSIFTFII